MKLVLKYMRRYWWLAVLAAGFMIAEVYVDLYQPRMMAQIVDEGILGLSNGGRSDVGLVVTVGIRMLFVVIAGAACGLLSAIFSNVTGQKFGNDIRKACFRKIMHFSFEQTDDFSTGSLVTRITNDVSQVQHMVMQLIRGLVRCLMLFAGGSAALLSLDLSFGVIVAIAFPLIVLTVVFILRKTNPMFLLLQKCLDRLNHIMQENVAGNRVVKAFVQEENEEKRFGAANEEYLGTQYRVQILLSFMRPVMNIVLNLAVIGIIYIGMIRVREGGVAPGMVMAAITYISQILNGMMMLAMIFQTLSRGSVSGKRLNEVLRTEPAIAGGGYRGEEMAAGPGMDEPEASGAAAGESLPQAGGAAAGECVTQAGGATADESVTQAGKVAARPAGSIRFRNVNFSYPGVETLVLRDIDLEIAPGETFAVIGATGSGKTTLINLIPRFYDTASGTVEVDGVDVRKYDLDVLRDKISVCLQKSELFSTTIRENIAMGKMGATQEEISAAARAAQAEDFILEQKDGYDTAVAERGMSLSGGQRQRIAISRALLKRGEILILDDSTSALDLKTEAALYEALDEEYGKMTRIIIAQRIASVRNADRIAVLDGGTIAAVGTHEELMETSEVYRDIYDSQLKTEPNAIKAAENDAGTDTGDAQTPEEVPANAAAGDAQTPGEAAAEDAGNVSEEPEKGGQR